MKKVVCRIQIKHIKTFSLLKSHHRIDPVVMK